MESLSPELATAIAMHKAGRLADAERMYRQLIGHVSQAAQAHSALGVLLTAQGRFSEAREHYERVVEYQPADCLAHKLLGDACAEQGDVEAAMRHFRDAARTRPDDVLWQLRADIASPLVFESANAIAAYRTRLAERLESYRNQAHRFELDELAASGCKPPISLAYQGRDDRPLKELFASIFANSIPADLPRTNTAKPHVGFVVTEGNEGVFLRGMAGVVKNLDLRQLKVTVVCAASAEGKCRRAIEREVGYLHLCKRFTETVSAIRAARFDLLYFWEVGTDCTNYFLPFFRLAPAQCTSWGWPVTSGIGEMDYFLSSQSLEPPSAERHYTEQLVKLRNLPNYYTTPDISGLNAKRDEFGIDRHKRIYFCGQNPRKLHPDFDGLIGRILRCDPQAVVRLVESAKPYVTKALRRRLEKRLPDCVERIRWMPRMSQAEYLNLMATADCVLDTPHYSGGANSTYDAFGVGAPVVTLRGEFHRGRYTAAAYQAMGMADCTASTPDEYVEIALRLAAERDFRRAMSAQISERRGVLFDNLSAVDELQEFFLTAIERTR